MTAIPQDPTLPQLPLLLEAEAATPLLARSLRRDHEPAALRVARVVYKPGERIAVHYRAQVDGRTEDAVAWAHSGRDLSRLPGRPRYRELAHRVDGRSPAATPFTYDAALDVVVSWLPFDPRLPALAEPPTALARRLVAVGLDVPGALTEPRRLAYKPGRRIVLRFGPHVLKAYAAEWQFERAARALTAVSRLEASLPELRLTAQAALAGAAPASAEEAAAEAGLLLRRLRRLDPSGLDRCPAETLLAAAARKAALIGAVAPPLQRRATRLLRALEASVPAATELVPSHGDFHVDQLVRCGGELHAVDVDALCLAPAALDVAEYATRAGQQGPEAVEALLERVLDGYGSRPRDLAWHVSAALLVAASHPFQRLTPGWPDEVDAVLASAEAALAPATPRRVQSSDWLEPLRRALDRSPRGIQFFFRDDDAGWENDRLLELLDLFAEHAVPLDVAVIPAALGPRLARELRARATAAPDLLGLHQHGFAHVDHEAKGRPCEFGPSRSASQQRRDLDAGARRLRALLGDAVAPIFTPPWNRCTETTGRCLLELGFRALARDSTAKPLALPGLAEIAVGVDWSLRAKDGGRIGLRDLGERLATAASTPGPTGVMLHHALLGRRDRAAVDALLTLLASHANAACSPLASLCADALRPAERPPARATPPGRPAPPARPSSARA